MFPSPHLCPRLNHPWQCWQPSHGLPYWRTGGSARSHPPFAKGNTWLWAPCWGCDQRLLLPLLWESSSEPQEPLMAALGEAQLGRSSCQPQTQGFGNTAVLFCYDLCPSPCYFKVKVRESLPEKKKTNKTPPASTLACNCYRMRGLTFSPPDPPLVIFHLNHHFSNEINWLCCCDFAKRLKHCRLWIYLVSYPYFLNFSFICCLLLFQSLTQLGTNLTSKIMLPDHL